MQWWVDLQLTGHPPFPMWELEADLAEEVRFLCANVELPEPDLPTA